MSHSYAPPAFPQFTPGTGALTNPDDGDPLLAASVNVAFEPLADRSKLAFLGLYGVQGARLVAYSAAPDTITIETTPIVRSSTRVLSGAIAPFSAATAYGAALAANTTYYVYVADVAGVLVPVVSTDPPDTATLKYRNGFPDQAFITFFRTDGAAAVRHFMHYEGLYLWELPITALSGGVAVVFTGVSLPNVTPFTRAALCTVLASNTDTTGPLQANFRPAGSTTTNFSQFVSQQVAATTTYGQSDPVLLVANTSGFEYALSTTGSVSVFLRGILL